jgi:hypothetical protein
VRRAPALGSTVRPVNVLLADEPLICRGQHPIPTDQWAWPHGGVRCRFKIPPGNAGICGLVYYWLAFPGGIRVVVEVTSAELHEMERARMDIDQVRAYLGLKWGRAA